MPARMLPVLALLTATAHAAPPAVDSVFPAGGRAGTEVEIQVNGKGLDKGSPQGWASHPGVEIRGGKKPGQFTAVIGAEVPPGACLLRFFNDEGASVPRIFVVGSEPEHLEKEPNDSVADAGKNEPRMNAVIHGALAKSGDVDTHAIRVSQGRAIEVELLGYSLGSPMDPALRLLDARGVEAAGSHDTHNLDPRLVHVPQADGVMFVQVFAFVHPPAADVSFKGSANHVYRLRIAEVEPQPEPPAEPEALTLPAQVRGRISKAAEEDRYRFSAAKGDELHIAVKAQAIHSALDPTVQILDSAGKSLQQADDGEKESLDPVLKWKAPAQGDFTLVVADRYGHGGPEHDYELSVKPFTPVLSATLAGHAFKVDAGKSTEVKINLKPSGAFAGKFKVRATNLPQGITCEEKEAPAKGGDVTLTLKAAADAAASQSPFAVEVITSAPDAEQSFQAVYAIPFTEPRGDLLIMQDTQPWLTVAGKPAPPPAASP